MPRLSALSRLSIVIGLIALELGFSTLDIRRFVGFPLATYGFSSDGAVVMRVDRGGPADRAGIRVGDHIAFGDNSPRSRYGVVRGVGSSPGETLSGTVTSGGQTRSVTLVAAPESISDQAFVALRFFLAFLTIGIAAALLLTRPDVATWGFFLFSLTVINLPGAVSNYVVPQGWLTAQDYVFWALLSASGVGGVLFALAFSGQPWTRWQRLAVAVTIASSVAVLAINWSSMSRSGSPIQDDADSIYNGFVLLVMLAGFVDSYRYGPVAWRQRLRWMIAGVLIALPAHYIAYLFFPGPLSYAQYVSLIAIQAVLPLTAAYAMFRKRVVDINFVVSRTIVYGVLTALLVGVFSLLDAVLSHSFAESRVSLGIDIVVALLLGFSLNSAHRRLDSLIDQLIFRRRHRAELELERSALGIIHASDENTITRTLVRLPTQALGLTGAALYRSDGAAFVKKATAGQFDSLATTLDRNDALPLYLTAEHQPVRLDSLPLSVLSDRHGAASGVLAIPLTALGELKGFVVFGAHQNGADIDPDEQRALVPLVRNSATAYEHVETAALRSRVAVLEAMFLMRTGNEAT